jgi:hypothetical protein
MLVAGVPVTIGSAGGGSVMMNDRRHFANSCAFWSAFLPIC